MAGSGCEGSGTFPWHGLAGVPLDRNVVHVLLSIGGFEHELGFAGLLKVNVENPVLKAVVIFNP